MAKYFAQTNNGNKATATATVTVAAVIVTATATTTTKWGQHKSLANILTQLAKIVQLFRCVAKRLQSNRQHIYSQFVSKPHPLPLPLPLSLLLPLTLSTKVLHMDLCACFHCVSYCAT